MYFLTLRTLFLFCISVYHQVEALGKCGFPGKPANANIVPELALYSENQTVTYNCPRPFSMFVEGSGTGIRRCTQNGTWTGRPPICIPLITLKKKCKSYPNIISSLLNNLVDDTTSTCLDIRPTGLRRWISIDLGERFGVRVVKLFSKEGSTLNVSVSVRDSLTNKTTECGSYVGKYAGASIRIDCLTLDDLLGFPGGIPGDIIIVEELSNSNVPLVFCDIDGYGYTGNAKCGQPEAPAFGSAEYTEDTRVEFKCQKSFILVGPKDRYCDSKGSWTHWPIGTVPTCRLENWQANFNTGKNCPALESRISNAAIFYQLDRSVAILECKEGYELAANKVLLCTGFGVWLGYAGLDAHCKKKLNCGEPPVLENYVLQQVEGFSGPAQEMYFCNNSAKVFGVSKCLDSGTWSGLSPNLPCESPTREPPTTYLSTEATKPTFEATATIAINPMFEANATKAGDFENTCSVYTNPVFISLAAWAGLSSIILLITCCYRRKGHLRDTFGDKGSSTKIKSGKNKRNQQDSPLCVLDDSQPVSSIYEIAH